MEEAPKYWILNNIHEEFSNIPKKIITLEKKKRKKNGRRTNSFMGNRLEKLFFKFSNKI